MESRVSFYTPRDSGSRADYFVTGPQDPVDYAHIDRDLVLLRDSIRRKALQKANTNSKPQPGTLAYSLPNWGTFTYTETSSLAEDEEARLTSLPREFLPRKVQTTKRTLPGYESPDSFSPETRSSRRLDDLYEPVRVPPRNTSRFEEYLDSNQDKDPYTFEHITPRKPEPLLQRSLTNDFDEYTQQEMNLSGAHVNPELEFRVRKGNLVRFYRNGDPNYKGLTTSVSQKQFATFETLLVWLNEKISTTAGVKYVFQIPDGREITDITDFIGGRSYVVSSVRKIIQCDYGESRERFWINKAPSAGRLRKQDHRLFVDGIKKSHSYPGSRVGSISYPRNQNGLISPTSIRPRVLLIRSNTVRSSSQKVILNPQTTQTFEEMLSDINIMVKLEFPPVQSLWTARAPQKQVVSFSQMFRTLKNHTEFLACGRENVPLEMTGAVSPVGEDYSSRVNLKVASKPKAMEPHTGTEAEDTPRTNRSTRFEIEQTPHPEQEEDRPSIKDERTDDKELEKPSSSEPDTKQDRRNSSDTEPPKKGHSPHVNGYGSPDSQFPTNAVIHKTRPRHSLDMDRSDSPDTSRAAQEAAKQPYRRVHDELPPTVNVQIHGKLREFHVPRYGQIEPESDKPRKRLMLEWVYGYRGRDARHNLHVLAGGELVYFVAAIGVVYDRRREKQAHYTGHTEDITCMGIHPDRSRPLVATGQAISKAPGGVSMVRIWDPYTMETHSVLGKNEFTAGISSVGFSGESGQFEEGAFLMAIDEDAKHTMTIWDWRRNKVIAKTPTTSDTVVWGCFHPRDFTILISFGKQHIYFWKLFWDPQKDSSGRILRDKKSGVFEVEDMPKFVTSLEFSLNGDVITGDSNGRIVVWSKDDQDAFIINRIHSHPMKHAHSKSVFALCMLEDGTLLSGGGNEIKAWDSMNSFKAVKDRVLPESAGYIRTLCPRHHGGADGNLFIGTTNNLVLEGSMQEKFSFVIQSHYQPYPTVAVHPTDEAFVTASRDNMVYRMSTFTHKVAWYRDVEGHAEELWALTTMPTEDLFVTAGYDQQVTLWNAKTHRIVWRVSAEKPCLSVAFDPSGSLVVVGTTVGRFIVLNAATGGHIASIQVSSESLDAMRFSPDGQMLAMGSHDNMIYIYDVLDGGQVFRKHGSGVLQGHRNFLTQLDWSTDSRYLQSVSGDYDLLFWDVHEMKEMWATKMRDTEWATQTCILGYNTLGAWSNLREGDDVNTVCRSANSDLLAVGDNQGAIKLYKYPCTGERPDYHIQKKYTGHVSCVRFTNNDHYLISSGGVEAAIIQWAVVLSHGDHR